MYLTYVKNIIKAQLQYRASTYLLVFAQFVAQFFFILSFYYLFQKFGNIKGYTYSQVIFVYGVFNTCFSIAEMFFKGILDFYRLIKSGEFDILLIRPRNLLLQVIGSKFEVSRVGRLVQDIIVLIYGFAILDVKWDLLKIVCFLLTIGGGIILFFCIFLFFATMTFWTIDNSAFLDIFMDGGKDILQYPVNVFNKGIKIILTYILPFAFINYYPILYMIGKQTNILYAFSPVILIIWFALSLIFWKKGIKNYSSTGS